MSLTEWFKSPVIKDQPYNCNKKEEGEKKREGKQRKEKEKQKQKQKQKQKENEKEKENMFLTDWKLWKLCYVILV